MKRLPKSECSCARCRDACEHTPGWFRPGEAEKAAKLLGLSLKVFFKRYLGVQWWVPDSKGVSAMTVFALAPALVGEKAGHEYPYNPTGTCVFYVGGRCKIHAAKPYECSHGNPCDPKSYDTYVEHREHNVRLWKRQQGQITELLGHKPREADGSPLEFLMMRMFA